MEQKALRDLAEGVTKAVLDKCTDSLFKKMGDGAKKKWDEFRVDFDIAFKEYLERSYDKYSQIKTILDWKAPKYIYKIFEVPTLRRAKHGFIHADSVEKVTDVSNFVLIQGTGGIGKSTLLKHLFLSELEKQDLIPIFVELKAVNDSEDQYEIEDFIFNELTKHGAKFDLVCLRYALQSGRFLFLLDGYDEIVTGKKNSFQNKLDEFCDRYSRNYFILTSRPCSQFVEMRRFTVLETCPLSKKQAVSLVGKIDYDVEIKERFIIKLNEGLYKKHQSFASNPLLLNIMLKTYGHYAEIPSKLHLFYSYAFSMLYKEHDATKGGYKRELRSGIMAEDDFKRVFSWFCYITYIEGKLEFTHDELLDTLKRIPKGRVEFSNEDFIHDLVNAVCVLYIDGITYQFSHRSFQEYFTAYCLKEMTDANMKKLGIKAIKGDILRASNDEVFPMLYDMAEEKFEKNILLPVIIKFDEGLNGDSKFDFYFSKLITSMFLSQIDEEERLSPLIYIGENSLLKFIYGFMPKYFPSTADIDAKDQHASFALYTYLHDNMNYKLDEDLSCEKVMQNEVIYNLVKETWVGWLINNMLKLRETLTKKLEAHELDLENLFPE